MSLTPPFADAAFLRNVRVPSREINPARKIPGPEMIIAPRVSTSNQCSAPLRCRAMRLPTKPRTPRASSKREWFHLFMRSLSHPLPIRRGTPLPFVSSAPKYRRRRARSQRSSPLISFPTGFLLKKQRAGTRERTFFRPGPLTRGSWSARKSAIIEAEKWRGDLRSLGRTQITEKGVDPLGDTPDSFCILMEAGEVTSMS